MSWHLWGGYPDEVGAWQAYAAPGTAAREDGLDWTDPRDGLAHVGTVASLATVDTAESDLGLCDGVAALTPSDAKGYQGRGVSITYGVA